ncbi:EthD family reductase [Blastomonas sp.]|uniref:EthD family reductase n=1 Tax=Blastomonas sp. TaxID=1909299 RepID=UPI00391C6798
MTHIMAIYPNDAGSRFDADYYIGRHTKFAENLLTGHGLIEIRSVLGRHALDGSTPPFWAISEMVFTSREAFDLAMAAHGANLFADLPNYTDVAPLLQVGTLVGA